jgi:hypothetical protein
MTPIRMGSSGAAWVVTTKGPGSLRGSFPEGSQNCALIQYRGREKLPDGFNAEQRRVTLSEFE